MRLLDPSRLVFVDECGTNVGLAPLRARAPRGERAFGKAPRNRGKNTTLLASMGLRGMGPPCLAVEGGTTKAVFEAYVERALAPSLSPGQVVVLDNLQAHKAERARRAVEQRGAELLFLPSFLLAGPLAHRGGVREGEGTATEGEGPHEGGAGGGDRPGAGRRHE